MSGDEPIIELEKGFDMVKKQGIDPFLKLIDTKDGTALKAKEFISVYDIIFKMCIQRDPYNWSEQMYQRYDQSIAHYLLHSVAPKLNEARTAHDVAFLREWTLRWNNHKLIVKGLSQLFMYLDRFYTKNTDGILQLRDQGFAVFKDNIFDQFSDQARICVLNAIEKERNSEEQDRHLLSEAVNVFVEMGMNYGNKKLQLYKNALETKIVEAAGAFYKRQSRIWLDQDSAPNYLIKAEKMLASEKARVESYLNRCTLEPLIRECYVQLLKTHQKALLEKKTGVDNMLTLNATEDLSRLYRLYSKYPADLDMIGDMVHDHIDKAGARIVSEAQESAKKAAAAAEGNIGGAENHDLVTRLIALHDQYAKVVNNCFEKSPVFQKALKKAFETFINADDRVSNLLAQYVNEVLKRGSKVHVDDVESTLDHIVFLYGYIHDKDMFERSYQIFLAHRLLMGLCESEHSEKSMIAKLKTESGYQWTNKLEGMFKDVQLSKELMTKFANVFEAKKTLDFQLEVNVCTTSYWPSSKKLSANVPKDLTAACEKYKRFYLNQHSGHKLQWRLDQGQAEVMVIFSAKARHALVLSTYQMMILLIFNETPTVNFKTVLDITGLPDYEIGHHLLSMCHPKVGVILKRPNNRQLAEDHQFKINPKYMNKLKKVVIPTMKPPEVDDKKKKEEEKLKELQRRHQMDAAIVRIMKTRKTLRHNQLVSEVVSQLKARFVPKPANIKKRIEALIEQEYLERSKDDRSMYNYLA